MQNFIFHAPTEIIFGRGAEENAASLVKKYNGSRVLIVYGEGSIVRSGLLDKVASQLTDAGLSVEKHGGAMPNPHLSFVQEGIKKAMAHSADFLLAIGGGSAIDAAKAIAHGTANPDTDVWKFWTREVALEKSLPVGVVLTLSAAGSETSASAVITNTEAGLKRGLGTDFNRPRFAVMNPELTFTIPRYPLACGIADILMHTLDRYFTLETRDNTLPNQTTDALAEALMRTVIANAPRVLANPADYEAQSELMWCGSLSHNGIMGLGRTMDFSVHQLGHELSGRFDVAHGASLTTMWGAWAWHVQKTHPARFAQYGVNVWGINPLNAESSAIEKTVKFFRSIEMPTNFTELGIGIQPPDILDALAESCTFFGKREVGCFKPLNKADILAIYTAANI
ncbi:MAG: iron-containing alcohol dehydrogenase [Defluviitaleaceae bacterium]|nr:iron-containing alcohol dehydrogenase [Defluviitaleaceae bacterium]MCL2275663.1 iron-containing alcohol dehydrogenase [Defluviitaleaceae bacterium]